MMPDALLEISGDGPMAESQQCLERLAHVPRSHRPFVAEGSAGNARLLPPKTNPASIVS